MKLITIEMLQYFKQKLEGLFVKKEFKTGSTTDYKVLSDHNLTDELVEKINNAGSATAVAESIATAKSEAISEANTYTDAEVADALAEAKSYSDTAEADAVSSANAYTDTEVSEALAEAKSYADSSEADAIAAAKTYTDETASTAKSEAVSEAKSYTDTQVSAAKTELTTAIGTAKTEANTYTDSQVAAAKTELTTTINTKISTAYKVKGSTTFSNLPALSEAEEGNVYNVTDAFTSTANFVEGAGQKYPAGSNIVCIEASEGVFKWDVLAGFIDTDVFVKTSDIEVVTEAEIDALFAA